MLVEVRSEPLEWVGFPEGPVERSACCEARGRGEPRRGGLGELSGGDRAGRAGPGGQSQCAPYNKSCVCDRPASPRAGEQVDGKGQRSG